MTDFNPDGDSYPINTANYLDINDMLPPAYPTNKVENFVTKEQKTNFFVPEIGFPQRKTADTITVDNTLNNLITEIGNATLSGQYLVDKETPQLMYARVAAYYGTDAAHAQRLYEYMSKQWFSPATPILSNGGTKKGLEISCFLNEVGDSLEDIVSTWNECVWLASKGGGIGSFWGNIRSVGEKIGRNGETSGVVPFIKVQEALTVAIGQGCYDEKTEILTENGWKKFADLKNYKGKVMQVDPATGEMSFVKPSAFYEYTNTKKLFKFSNKTGTVNTVVTGNHRMGVERRKMVNREKVWPQKLEECLAQDLRLHRDNKLWVTGKFKSGIKENLSPEDKLRIAYQADGSTLPSNSNGNISGNRIFDFKFSKPRKIKRLKKILDAVGCGYTEHDYLEKHNYFEYAVRFPLEFSLTKNFSDWINLEELSSNWCKEFVEELAHWDSSKNSVNNIIYFTTSKENADYVQAIACMAGYHTYRSNRKAEGNIKKLYKIHITTNTHVVGGKGVKIKQVKHIGVVYCVTVPTGMVLTKRGSATLVCGNSLRRGNAAAYLQISHPEIEEFVDIRRPTGGDPIRKAIHLHHGIFITDEFMHAVRDDNKFALRSPKTNAIIREVSARDLWIRILTARLETGEPYLVFENTVHNAVPESHRLLNLYPKMSNLCVAPETKILTRNGYKRISKLEDQKVEVWNGKEWSKVTIKKTAENAKLITVKLSNGMSIACTPEHKFYVQDGYARAEKNNAIIKEVRAKDLQPKDKLIKFDMPLDVKGKGDFPYGYAHGFYCGDGFYDNTAKRPAAWFYGEKAKLMDRVRACGPCIMSALQSERPHVFFGHDMPEKFKVPLGYSVKSKLDWLAGLVDSDGTATNVNGNMGIQVGNINKKFLRDTLLLLQELGVFAKIRRMQKARKKMMLDGRGGQAMYDLQEVNRLIIPYDGVCRLIDLGFKPSRLNISNKNKSNRNAEHFVTVISVKDKGRKDATFCFTEPKRHMGVFNGVLTGQCSEILLPTGKDHLNNWRTAVCCLSSLNLVHWNDWKKDPQFISDVMEFLDNVLQNFIENAPDQMQKAKYSAMRERSVGLGVMGFHTFLQNNNIPFDSLSAKSYNKIFFKHIRQAADKVSVDLAERRGSNPDSLENNIKERFTYKMAVAPTATISIICGSISAGIEPIPANAYLQKTLNGRFTAKNPQLKKVLENLGKDTEEVWKSIIDHKGSVQHLKFLDNNIKDVFKTAFEIDQRAVIDMAADRTQYIDQSQSINIFLEGNVHKGVLHALHYMAWEKGVKSLYYCRSSSVQDAEHSDKARTKKTKEQFSVVSYYEECTSCT